MFSHANLSLTPPYFILCSLEYKYELFLFVYFIVISKNKNKTKK